MKKFLILIAVAFAFMAFTTDVNKSESVSADYAEMVRLDDFNYTVAWMWHCNACEQSGQCDCGEAKHSQMCTGQEYLCPNCSTPLNKRKDFNAAYCDPM